MMENQNPYLPPQDFLHIFDDPNYIPPCDAIDVNYSTPARVLQDLVPGCEFIIRGDSYEDIEWMKTNRSPKPTKQEFETRRKELSDLWEQHRYKRLRRLAYPSFEQQLDVLYNGGYEKWKEMLLEIKNKYPKPEDLETSEEPGR